MYIKLSNKYKKNKKGNKKSKKKIKLIGGESGQKKLKKLLSNKKIICSRKKIINKYSKKGLLRLTFSNVNFDIMFKEKYNTIFGGKTDGIFPKVNKGEKMSYYSYIKKLFDDKTYNQKKFDGSEINVIDEGDPLSISKDDNIIFYLNKNKSNHDNLLKEIKEKDSNIRVYSVLAANSIKFGGLYGHSYNNIINNGHSGTQEEELVLTYLSLNIDKYQQNTSTLEKDLADKNLRESFFDCGLTKYGTIIFKNNSIYDDFHTIEFFKKQIIDGRYKNIYSIPIAVPDFRQLKNKILGHYLFEKKSNLIEYYIALQFQILLSYIDNTNHNHNIITLPLIGGQAFKCNIEYITKIYAKIFRINKDIIKSRKIKIILTWATDTTNTLFKKYLLTDTINSSILQPYKIENILEDINKELSRHKEFINKKEIKLLKDLPNLKLNLTYELNKLLLDGVGVRKNTEDNFNSLFNSSKNPDLIKQDIEQIKISIDDTDDTIDEYNFNTSPYHNLTKIYPKLFDGSASSGNNTFFDLFLQNQKYFEKDSIYFNVFFLSKLKNLVKEPTPDNEIKLKFVNKIDESMINHQIFTIENYKTENNKFFDNNKLKSNTKVYYIPKNKPESEIELDSDLFNSTFLKKNNIIESNKIIYFYPNDDVYDLSIIPKEKKDLWKKIKKHLIRNPPNHNDLY